MLEAHLRVPNLCWRADKFDPPDIGAGSAAGSDALSSVVGRFATAHRVGDRVRLARDTLGLNKLFFAVDPARGVLAANYLLDLVKAGVPFDTIYAVPAGATVEIDIRRRELTTRRYHLLPRKAGQGSDLGAILDTLGQQLRRHLELVAATFPTGRVAICLSGGADSGLVAAHATDYFPDATAYTYTYRDANGPPSQDAENAERLATHLGFRFRLVQADADTVFDAVHNAIRFGQDWRDFNVHCAVVNAILAEAIAADVPCTEPHRTLVLTGDLMNELLGDYTPVRYACTDYYRLPEVTPERLRISLVRGIQTGDREVGVFRSRGLDVMQPYATVFDDLLRLPSTVAKAEVIRTLAGGRLPAEVYRRPKIRAQIGDPVVRRGILPLLIDSGRDARWLENRFCKLFKIDDRAVLRRFIRGGVYRCADRFPGRSHG